MDQTPKIRKKMIIKYIKKARLAAIALIGCVLACSSALHAQNTWYFVGGGTGAGFPMIELDNWNSQADGNGSAPTSFDTSDTWILNGLGTRVGNNNNDTFLPTLTSLGAGPSTEVAALRWDTRRTYLTQVNIGAGNALFTTGRDNTTCGLGITTLNLDGTMIIRGNIGAGATLRHTQLHVGTLVGSGNIYAGDATQGYENVILSLAIEDASDFTGQVRFRNTTGGFLGDTDLSSAQLFINEADHPDRFTTFDVRHNIIVKELNIQARIIDTPGIYDAAALTALLEPGERIQFVDNGGTVTIMPDIIHVIILEQSSDLKTWETVVLSADDLLEDGTVVAPAFNAANFYRVRIVPQTVD